MEKGLLYINQINPKSAIYEVIQKAIFDSGNLFLCFKEWLSFVAARGLINQPFDFAVMCLNARVNLQDISNYLRSNILSSIPESAEEAKIEARKLVEALFEVVNHLATAYQDTNANEELQWFQQAVFDALINAGDYGDYAGIFNSFLKYGQKTKDDQKMIAFFIDFIKDKPQNAVEFFKILKDKVPKFGFNEEQLQLANKHIVYFGRLALACLRIKNVFRPALQTEQVAATIDIDDEYFVRQNATITQELDITAQNKKRFASYAYGFSGITVTALLIYYRSHVWNAMIAVMKPIVALVLAHKLFVASGFVVGFLSAFYVHNNYWKKNESEIASTSEISNTRNTI